MMPSPSDLTYFVEVGRTQNLSRAAERLGVSQPSLTLAIQRLEGTLGTELLIRSKTGVTLTQAGKQLWAHSRELLQMWDTVKAETLASTNEVQGSFVLGCHPSVAIYSLPQTLPSLLEKHPRLELKLVHNLSRKIAEGVIRLEVDVGIVVNPVRHPDLVIQKLCEDEVTFWSAPGGRSTQDLRSGNAVLICEPDLLQTQDLLKKLAKAGIRYGRVLPSANLEVVTTLAASGAGVGILPARVAGTAAGQGLKRVPKAPVFKDEVCLLYRMENRGVRAIQEIASALSNGFRA